MVQNASQNTTLELYHAVKAGDHAALSTLLSTAHFSNAALSSAMKDACAIPERLDCIKALVGYINPKRENSLPLQLCARRGDAEAVRFLIPLSTPAVNQSQALRAAACNGYLDAAFALLPFCSPADAVLTFSDAVKAWEVRSGVFKEESSRVEVVLLRLLDHIGIPQLASWHLENTGKSLDMSRYDVFFDEMLNKRKIGIGDLAPFFEQEVLAAQLPSLKVGWDAFCLEKQTLRPVGPSVSRRL